ncbi:hypothetical protein FH972_021761 [Carpinus fangiana]|uniref:Asteroid domain-containing protein n=1 Tax=Carpinus fangiana TaxID=176857 RepID=A0A5N6KQL9_9ROSI|nr:hypothetical protein FH972_021761 [Carpinus fangiana]
MGVQGLLSAIRPYATEEIWEPQESPTVRRGLVVDGPALAYHVYYRCLAHNNTASNALVAVPSYDFLCQATLAFLGRLELYGLKVKKIFFDGALPTSKTAVRIGRMQKSVDEMRAFKNLNPVLSTAGSSPGSGTDERVTRVVQSQPGYVRQQLKSIPAAPFIVAALKEYLLSTHYGHAVQTVPCEADSCCTSRQYCGRSDVILTSDSDFILQMPLGQIVFFNELDLSESGLRVQTYDCQHIATRLGLSEVSMTLMGYHMREDSHAGIVECAKRASEGKLKEDEAYVRFRAQYHPWLKEQDWADVFFADDDYDPPGGRNLKSDLTLSVQSMDPRVLEYVVSSLQDRILSFMVFMPPLLEDPARSTAWLPSAANRFTAYCLWMQGAPDMDSIRSQEWDRHGLHATCETVSIDPISNPNHLKGIRELLSQISRLTKSFKKLQKHHCWAVIALITFLREVKEHGTLPLRKDVARLVSNTIAVTNSPDETVSWSQIHLNAQLEAWFYSLRMLKQFNDLCTFPQPENADLEQLHELLQQMPPLHSIFRTPIQGMDFGPAGQDHKLHKELNTYYPNFNAERDAHEAPEASDSRSAKKKKRKAAQEQRDPRTLFKAPRNMYDVLPDNDAE